MPVTFDLPSDLEQRIRGDVIDLGQAAKESFLIDLYRRGTVSRYQLAQALGLDRFETEALLHRHGVTEGSLSSDDLEADRQTLEGALGPADAGAAFDEALDEFFAQNPRPLPALPADFSRADIYADHD